MSYGAFIFLLASFGWPLMPSPVLCCIGRQKAVSLLHCGGDNRTAQALQHHKLIAAVRMAEWLSEGVLECRCLRL